MVREIWTHRSPECARRQRPASCPRRRAHSLPSRALQAALRGHALCAGGGPRNSEVCWRPWRGRSIRSANWSAHKVHNAATRDRSAFCATNISLMRQTAGSQAYSPTSSAGRQRVGNARRSGLVAGTYRAISFDMHLAAAAWSSRARPIQSFAGLDYAAETARTSSNAMIYRRSMEASARCQQWHGSVCGTAEAASEKATREQRREKRREQRIQPKTAGQPGDDVRT